MKINFIIDMPLNLMLGGIVSAMNSFQQILKKNNIEFYINNIKNDYDILHTQTVGPFSLAMIKRAKMEGRKVVVHAHTTHLDFQGSFTFSRDISKLLKLYLKGFYNNGDIVITPTPYSKDVLKKTGVKRRIEVLSNGVDTKKFINGIGKYKENDTVYSVGHVFIRKGIDTFIKTANFFPDYKFLWYGKRYNSILVDPVNMYKAMILKSDNMKFMGFVKNIVKIHNSNNIFLFPSYVENQGIAIMEAMSCMKPVIVRNLPVYDGWLRDGENCLKADNDKEFVKKLQMLIEDKKFQKKLGAEALKTAKKNDLDIIGKRLLKIYENILKE